MEHMEQILTLEDDVQIRTFIAYVLRNAGYRVIAAQNAQAGMQALLSEHIDLMLLDLGLPDCDGMEVIQKVRQWSDIPILVVSARDQDREKALALDAGADDYLTKPFSATELLARIRVAIRHLQRERYENGPAKYQVGGLSVDYEKRQVRLDGQELHVTPMEYSMLVLLSKNAGKVLTTRQILKEVWGGGYGDDTQPLRALMAGLRRKVEKNPAKPRYLLTEVGVGYRMADE